MILDIDNILVSSDIITEQFCCDLDACKGICCVEGDAGAPVTLEEIGDRFGLTRERVRQIKEKAIRRLRHNTKNKILKSYLGQ